MNNANEYLQSLPRIDRVEKAADYASDVFLLPPNIDFYFDCNNLVKTTGLGAADKKLRDLIRVINIVDPFDIKYEETNILTPLIYAESLDNILWHLNTQGILITIATDKMISWIKKEVSHKNYGKHDLDQFWLPFCQPVDNLKPNDVLYVCNRRVGGWDGSLERPVIELLGAGGHLPIVWQENERKLRPLTIKENFVKELDEELGMVINEDKIKVFGGYKNNITHELVVLTGILIPENDLYKIQEYAIQNIDEDTKGIYMGTFKEVIDYYGVNPNPFAGGAKAAPYNFPSKSDLMSKVFEYISHL